MIMTTISGKDVIMMIIDNIYQMILIKVKKVKRSYCIFSVIQNNSESASNKPKSPEVRKLAFLLKLSQMREKELIREC